MSHLIRIAPRQPIAGDVQVFLLEKCKNSGCIAPKEVMRRKYLSQCETAVRDHLDGIAYDVS